MHARLPDRTFKAGGPLHEFVYGWIGRLERRIKVRRRLASLLERYLRRVGHKTCKLVRIAERIVHHTPDILYGRLRGHLSESDDMRDMVGAILASNVIKHPFATGVIEVDIYIGHRNAVGVEEPLKQQIILEGIDIGDSERIGYGRTCRRATTWADPYSETPCRVNVIVDNQKVAGEAHSAYGIKLVLHAFDRLDRQRVTPAPLGASPH